MFRQIVKFRQLQTLDAVKSNVDSVSFQGRRSTVFRTYKAGINIEWNPPPALPCYHPDKSGDKSTLPELDKTRLTLQFSRAPKVDQILRDENIPDKVKKLSTLEYAPRSKQIQVLKDDTMSSVRRHLLDTASLEATIAALTISIRNQQGYLKDHRTNTNTRVSCKEDIERRKSLLKHLRKYDYKRFEWLLEKLDLVYHPLPNPIVPVTRKGSLMRLTTVYCDKIRNERLEAYKKELQAQKDNFLKEKAETEKWIEEEERKLGLRS
uniref:Small ribosomal subunit protein uS15m n=1 Tax=Moina brachiata TaxID=675436 RepID=A0A4Y7NIR6_9CRUS|nr:EOG090X09BQ [Moina brachiata]SVE93118.1 EOG090X09BQ [Moina brachiata]